MRSPMPTMVQRWGALTMQRSLAALDAAAPPLAARAGTTLWFRLPPTANPGRRRRLEPDGGTPFEVTGRGLTVRGRAFGHDGQPTAYLVHGWGGHWQQLAVHVGPLRELGYRVVVHDAPSHGDSPPGAYGPRASRVMEMALAHALVVEQHCPATLTVAHSLGAMVVLWAAQHHGTGPGALVTIAAATDLDELIDSFRRMTGLGPRSRAGMLDRIERTVGHPRTMFQGPALARATVSRHGTLPMLSVHDSTDVESPSWVSEQLVSAWPGASLLLTEGLGHRRVIRDPTVVARVAQFAAEQQRRSHPQESAATG